MHAHASSREQTPTLEMIIGNTGSQHRGECSWWAQGPRCLEQIQEWAQWVQHCHVSSDNEVSECVTFADGILCVKVEGVQQLLKMAMDNGNILIPETDEPSKVEPRVQVEPSRQAEERSEDRVRKACPFTECRILHGPPGTLEVVYAQVKRLLDWEALPLITQDLRMSPINGNAVGELNQKVIMDQGPWCDEESTMAWERYMQTEGLSQHVCCQHCDSTEKPMAVFWAL
jgi:hypothetical protein